MGFKLLKQDTRKIIVDFKIPDDGDILDADLEIQYNKLTVSDYRKFTDKLSALGKRVKDGEESVLNDMDDLITKTLLDNVVDMVGIKDADDNPIEYSKKLLKEMLEISFYREPIQVGFGKVQNDDGLVEKN